MQRLAALFLWTLIFAAAHTQAPLYFSNQNQYYLHGMAQGGHGNLHEDWLANTVDPTPVFSAVIEFTQRYLDVAIVWVYYGVFLGIYLYALLAAFEHVTEGKASSLARLCYLTILIVIHAALLRLLSVQFLGKDYPWYLQAGVAGQYILGPVFQPSVGGVLLLAALVLFLRDRPWLALASAVGAAIFHATYVLGAIFVIAGYLTWLGREKRLREALLLSGAAGLVLIPWIAYNYLVFGPTTPKLAGDAQEILVHTRIPHHAEVSRWFDWIATAQIAWIGLAIGLAWRSRLFWLIWIPFLFGAVLTIVQFISGNDALALLFPWRISAVLVPLATAYLLARVVRLLSPWLDRASAARVWGVRIGCALALIIAVAGGIVISAFGLAYHINREELTLLEFVRTHKQPGELYLLPVEMAKSRSGSPPSTSFTPPPRRGQNTGLIAVDLQRFRLYTGAPIFVDFKSIPYKDVDVLEWLVRMQRTETKWYKQQDWSDLELRAELEAKRITHVVMPAGRRLQSPWFEQVHEDAAYRVYRLRPVLAGLRTNDTPVPKP